MLTPGPIALSLCLLHADQDVRLSVTDPAPCLSTFHHDDRGPTLSSNRRAKGSKVCKVMAVHMQVTKVAKTKAGT